MARRVRIEGDPEVWEVLAETATTLLLVNPAARQRRTVAVLEQQLREARTRLSTVRGAPETREASP